MYEGEYKDDKIIEGESTWVDGVYEGEFKDSKMHGQGKFTYPDDSVYEGEFKDDKKHGQGLLGLTVVGMKESGKTAIGTDKGK